MTHSPLWTLTARWIFPVDGPPLEGGTVSIAGPHIVAVEPAGVRTPDLNLGNTAVIPGLVNCHTHLDLTGLRGQCPPTSDFTGWLRSVIQYRRGLSIREATAEGSAEPETPTRGRPSKAAIERVGRDIVTGLTESLRAGVTLMGDISAQGLSWYVLASFPKGRFVVFYEVLGLPLDRAEKARDEVRAWLKSRPATPTMRLSVSPHAPYSVRPFLFDAAADLTRSLNVPLATHVAETREELELLATHSGPFVDFLKELGVWDQDGLATGTVEIVRRCLRAGRALLVHGNYLPADAPVPPWATIVYCPRTHAAFGHAPHPFREFLARNVRVALGTDSLASNPNLDLLAEAQFLHELYPDFPGSTLLRMATLSGAEALGWETETGSLTPGKSADLVAVPLPDREVADPHDLLWAASQAPRGVLWQGQWLHRLDGTGGAY